MKLTQQILAEAIQAALDEIDIEDVGEVCFTGGSTHVMKTCKIDNEKYYLKFSDEDLFDSSDPSLQILVEYLAYRIYSLYPGVSIPDVKLVWDKKGNKVGLASSEVSGKPGRQVDPKKLAKLMTAGIFVDVFLANWDVIGTGGEGNVIVSPEKATRIDPGGSLTFRAQGAKKGSAFSDEPGELQTMLKKQTRQGAGDVYQYAELAEAGKIFAAVPWTDVYSKMVQANNEEIVPDMKRHGMKELLAEWKNEITHIAKTLKNRHKAVIEHIAFVESKGNGET